MVFLDAPLSHGGYCNGYVQYFLTKTVKRRNCFICRSNAFWHFFKEDGGYRLLITGASSLSVMHNLSYLLCIKSVQKWLLNVLDCKRDSLVNCMVGLLFLYGSQSINYSWKLAVTSISYSDLIWVKIITTVHLRNYFSIVKELE